MCLLHRACLTPARLHTPLLFLRQVLFGRRVRFRRRAHFAQHRSPRLRQWPPRLPALSSLMRILPTLPFRFTVMPLRSASPPAPCRFKAAMPGSLPTRFALKLPRTLPSNLVSISSHRCALISKMTLKSRRDTATDSFSSAILALNWLGLMCAPRTPNQSTSFLSS